ncbi:hypothetical protein HK105_202402 [Polyrhizophydium stewartii]|uniref:Uncharacterized protein n=1 Tax=Polyrhizophydium stewartii TaxID=2732419 RepID=A0ABR4NEN6_9FUNG|nr:hypothetical protein HK105_001718 [Polyrhizophydium stewartii]
MSLKSVTKSLDALLQTAGIDTRQAKRLTRSSSATTKAKGAAASGPAGAGGSAADGRPKFAKGSFKSVQRQRAAAERKKRADARRAEELAEASLREAEDSAAAEATSREATLESNLRTLLAVRPLEKEKAVKKKLAVAALKSTKVTGSRSTRR